MGRGAEPLPAQWSMTAPKNGADEAMKSVLAVVGDGGSRRPWQRSFSTVRLGDWRPSQLRCEDGSGDNGTGDQIEGS